MTIESSRFYATLKHIAIEIFVIFVVGISLIVAAINLWLDRRKHAIKNPSSSTEVPHLQTLPPKELKITIIIATKNESRTIGETMRNFESTTFDKSLVEIIIVDVGSKDRTIEVARASSGSIPVTFIKRTDNGSGRGLAINEGFLKASGDILLILRADSLVPPRYDEIIRREFGNSKILFGAFEFAIDKKSSTRKVEPPGLWILAHYFNLRSSLFWFPSAMQGLALSSETFYSHQFPDHVIMDDVAFYLNIRRTCLSCNLEFKQFSQPIRSSSNRWENVGVLTWLTLDSIAHYAFINLRCCPENVYYFCYEFLPRLKRKILCRKKS